MCGIVGYRSSAVLSADSGQLISSLELMRHRGPDDRGLMLIGEDGPSYFGRSALADGSVLPPRPHHAAMGHVRFSIVDLTDAGHQPFVTSDRRISLTFNGEIYNYVELREQLKRRGYDFLTNTDTEVLANAYLCWGVACFERFVGFWALALYDNDTGQILLARDRIGKAPLYYCLRAGVLYWASELKVLLRYVPDERHNIRLQSVAHFANWLKKDFADTTFYENIRTFPKASYAWVSEDGTFLPQRYWDLPQHRLTESQITRDNAVERFRELMSDAVRIRHRADAPVAVQLSGGLDSSTLVASAVDYAGSVDAYTIQYGYGDQNEEPYARAVADLYRDRVKYHVVYPGEDCFVGKLGAYAELMDEPYHSPNQLSGQHIWHQMAEHGLRVVLYGAGGDEVFGGYAHEYYAPYLNHLLGSLDARRFLKEFFSCTEYRPGLSIKDYLLMLAKMIPGVPRQSTFGRIRFIPREVNPLSPELLAENRGTPPAEIGERLRANMQDWRMNYWLRIDNQNSMGVPVELRSPFLDHRLIEFAFQLPISYLIRDGWMKWIVRQSMQDRLPASVVWRREKMGFPFPLKAWLLKNRQALQQEIGGVDCPYVDGQKLIKFYDELCSRDCDYVWGLIAILLWWKYCIAREC